MAAIGLFTLNTSKLNEGVLGGLGTGFAEATRTRIATAAGAPGFAGSASNASTRTATASGVAGFVGSASATRTTTSTATGSPSLAGSATSTSVATASTSGSPGLGGSASDVATRSATATGSPDVLGAASAMQSTTATTTGSPDLVGSASAARTRSSSAQGTPDVPPPPPPPPPAPDVAVGSGPRLFYPQRPRKVEPQATHAVGSARGYRRARAVINGAAGRTGAATATHVTTSMCVGVRWPDDIEVVRRRHVARLRRQEADLILLEL